MAREPRRVNLSATPSSRSNRGLHLLSALSSSPTPPHRPSPTPPPSSDFRSIPRHPGPNPPRRKAQGFARSSGGAAPARARIRIPAAAAARIRRSQIQEARIRSPSFLVPARFPSRGALGRPACCSRLFFRVGASCLDSSGGGAGGGSSLMLPARPPRIAAR